MYPDFTKKFGFRVHKIKVDAQKINSSKQNIFGIIIASFSVEDKEKKSRFFEETFLLADISIDIALRTSFFTLSNDEIDLVGCHIYWRTYTVTKILLTMRQVKLIGIKEFAAVILYLKDEAFVVYVASIN